jgi:hypothetical protein
LLLPGVQLPEKIERPDGLAEGADSHTFGEEDLELHLAIVY